MKVQVKILLPTLPEAIGDRELEVDFEGVTVNDLMDYLLAQYGQKAKSALYDEEGELDPIVQVLINGETWVTRENLDTTLHEGDSIVFMMMIAGG